MKIAYLIFDDRVDRPFPEPIFGSSPTALLQGLSALCRSRNSSSGKRREKIRIHVISCVKKALPNPRRIYGNICFHQLVVPSHLFLRSAYLGPLCGVTRLLRKLRPDIVHAQGTESWCGMAGSRSFFPKVLTLHGNVSLVNLAGPMRPYGYWLAQELLESLSLPRYNEVFCNSEYSRRGAAPNARATRLMPNPVRLEFFGRRISQPDTAVPVLLNIGVIQERKRQLELCRMAIRLHRQGYRFLLRFIGFCGEGSAYAAEFRQVLSEAEKLGCAEYAGLRSAFELVDELDRAKALIHFPKEEAFGLVVAEALCRNLKIFAADLGGIPDILQGAAEAELFPADAWGLLENRLASWLKGGAPRASEGAELARQRFHPEVIAGAHLEAYRRILSPSAGASMP